ncbi:MAG: hypothetical protein C4325_03195 [Blastocatellia bacterium]
MRQGGKGAEKRHFTEIIDELGGELAIAFFVDGKGAGKIEVRQFVNLLRSIESSLSDEHSKQRAFPRKDSAATTDQR